jgi:hypothetical protein
MPIKKVITPKIKKQWGKQGGMAVGVDIPKTVLAMSDKKELAAEAAWRMAKHLRELIGSGREASGTKHEPTETTKKRRKRNMTPPKYRRKEYTAKGKLKKGKTEWDRRFQYGPSLGGDTFFVDSGLLAGSIHPTLEGAPDGVSLVSVHPRRFQALYFLHKKYEVLSVTQPPLDKTVKRAVEKAARLEDRPDRLIKAIFKAIERQRAKAATGKPIRE